MKHLLAMIFGGFMILGTGKLTAQEFVPPVDLKLEKPADYAACEPDVIRCIDYLEKTPLSDRTNRKDANAFLFKWLSGSPTVNVDLLPYVMNLAKINKDFLMIFMGGWTKYALETKDLKNKTNGHLAGLRAIIRVYKENKGVTPDDAVDEVVTAEKDGKLEAWLKEKMEQK